MKVTLAVILAALSMPIAHAEDSPRQAAEKAAAQAMVKAQAEKAKNDEIVAQQRAAEAAAKKKPTPAPTSTPQGK